MTSRATLILNGKRADDMALRSAVHLLRDEGYAIDVRVTWEEGDAARLTAEAIREGRENSLARIIAGGGDGTVNQVFAAAHEAGLPEGCSLGILPLGTANDFAMSTGIACDDPEAALRLALSGPAVPIDLGLLDGQPFVNLVTGGFGSQVTAQTDSRLKEKLGPFAYVLSALGRVSELQGCTGRFTAQDFAWEGAFVAFAIGNGRQAGGGFALCADALLDDGLLDLTILPVPDSGLEALATLLREGSESLARQGVTVRSPWVAFEADEPLAINLDGEPQTLARFRAECCPRALPVHLGNRDLLSEGG